MASESLILIPILSRLSPPKGAVRNKRRKGRGVGSGLGKTSGKGMKGQKARHPGGFGKLHFEGGQTPLQRRLPKIGFWNPHRTNVAEVNLKDLERFEDGTVVDEQLLRSTGLVKGACDEIKLLGNGSLTKKLQVKIHRASEGAKTKLLALGGTIELLAVAKEAD